ncbi:TPA: hypothetical protein NVL70_002812 [Enterobacter hormaechei subsp. xiangfangensis]|nr:hypothetical protein [Enterobacter hormaechei subsp. xiangfangensis]
MSIKNLVEMIKRNGLLASMPQLEELYQVAIENELKLAESQREFRAADATIENLQMKLEKMAAENAGLKQTESNLVRNIINDLGDTEFQYSRVHTPATDAFLAEVRASGVEMFAAVLRRKGDDAFFDAIAEAQANAADQFAAQLRKGVQL